MQQPHLEVRSKQLIDVDGLRFKDLNGNGELDPYEDWRLTPAERAADLVARMDLDELVGMMLINTRFTGFIAPEGAETSHDGALDERTIEAGTSIFATRKVFGTTETIERLKLRHFILRDPVSATQLATWNNAMNEVAESTRLGIPTLAASNSRNENGEPIFGMNDAVGAFSTFPATLGIAAAILGDLAVGGDASLASEFAAVVRQEWLAAGIRKGYLYMADVVTDPRWQRIYGTFGEDPALIADIIGRLVAGLQGERLDGTSVATTIKHFPGGGARENGFDPHYAEGKWNCYPTPGSFEAYHLPPFRAATATSSFMPYYSAPSIAKSVVQAVDGVEIPYEEVGFAFNRYVLHDLLRGQLGFTGYVNSDSGITDNMCWGVEDLSIPERFAKTINAGTDLVADTNNVADLRAAVDHGWITRARLEEACSRLLIEMFALGLFDEHTYVDAAAADGLIAASPGWELAAATHRKSVVALKNSGGTLPLPAGTTVYVEVFHRSPERAELKTTQARAAASEHAGLRLVERPEDADAVVLFADPQSGNYFSSTPGLLELTLCEDKQLTSTGGETYAETTLLGADRFRGLARDARARGQKVVLSVNLAMPWILDDVEPLADALVAGFSTFFDAQFDVLTGASAPHGRLPITLPASEAVIAVDEQGRCASPNDVPGFAKQQYMPEGSTYAYRDADGNDYVLGHGLTW
ncbi:glycoside hydrolase family 3 protein [Propioniciclava coleopterorum]|uniref:beta-glucosidase n=1 Tax=Propioniciclava coleopterorum TaxID=2714937 RepID=A0A6G7Y349_9ACTN|nr:glycoside hydrolase family 3 N-terminal domain-containing protein [Propioniciclava coleopterorum]QIK71116.1 glycoside hydrolase family 3 protein [Propioniciclava coleopterorum]